ncbi:MAG: alkyl hydroperoxide reductase subunit F [Bacteroidales bacterium]
MLDQALKQQVQTLLQGLNAFYTFLIRVASNHPQKQELVQFLTEVAECSDHLDVKTEEGDNLEFTLLKDNQPVNILFKAIPSGHEFSTLLLLLLNLDGKGKNFPDNMIRKRIERLQGDIQLTSYISLSCTNCPDVVQNLNLMAILNPAIHHTIIDGAINQQEAEAHNIQAVPSVFASDELAHVGRGSLSELLEKLEARYGSTNTETVENYSFDVLVMGGGPAGSAAAIYSARKGLSVAIVAEAIGGQVLETTGIENLISVSKTTGKQLGLDLKNHLSDYPVTILDNRRVRSVESLDGKKTIITSAGERLSAPALIVATGASWRRLNVPGENDYIGTGIAFCTHCDGPLYKNKRTVVVGGGNSGLEAAIDLSAIATHVTLIEFADQLKGDQLLQEKLKTLPNVTVITNAAVQEVSGNGAKVTGIRYRDRISGSDHQVETDGVFIQIGLSPNSELLKELVETTPQGEIKIDQHCRTSANGIYAAGDVSTVPFKQIIVAMGEGAKAALTAFEDKIKGILD